MAPEFQNLLLCPSPLGGRLATGVQGASPSADRTEST